MSAIINIRNKVSREFAMKMATSIFYSKVLYHIELWGITTMTNLKKIDKVLIKMAKYLNGYGRSDDWNLKRLKWLNIKETQAYTAIKYTHKLINSESDHTFKHYLLQNRSTRNRIVMKLGPHKPIIGRSSITQSTYLYTMINQYNQLPDSLTKINKHEIFKKWLKKIFLDKKIIIPINKHNPDNLIEDPNYNQYNNNNICKGIVAFNPKGLHHHGPGPREPQPELDQPGLDGPGFNMNQLNISATPTVTATPNVTATPSVMATPSVTATPTVMARNTVAATSDMMGSLSHSTAIQ